MGQDRDRWSQTTSTLGSEQDDEWDKTTFHDRDDHLRSEASMLASMLNLLNNVVGAGLFSLSWCLYESTLVTGMCMMVFMGVLNALSFILLAQCCELAGTCSYLKMMQSAFGRTGGLAAQIIVLMYGCGSCISFVVLTGDFLCGSGTGVLDSWSSNEWLHKRWLIMSGVAVFVFFPLSCMRNLEPLKYTSSVSLLATMYAAAVCVWALALDNDDVFPPELKNQSEELRDSVDYIGFPVGVFAALPLVNVAFTCHYNAPRYYNELKDRTPRRWSIVVFVVMTFAMMIYAAAAVTGYLVFGNQIDGDILKNFSDKWSPAVVARLALACLVIFTFPMVCHFIRDSIIDLYWDGKYTTDSCPTKEFLLITAAIIVISTTVGVTVTKVEVVLAYKGAIFGSCMVYIFPPIMYCVLRQRSIRGSVEGNSTQVQRESEGSAESKTNRSGKSDESAPLVATQLRRMSYWQQVREVLTDPRNWMYNLLVLWGVVTGILGVVVTVLQQSGAIASG